MSDIQLYLVEAGKRKDEAKQIARDVASKLERKEIQLLAVIESVGEYINNEDANLRSQSLAFLSDVLEALPLRVFSLQQRALLTEFVVSRIQDDTEGLGSCAKALASLERMGKWDTETAKKIFASIITSPHTLRSMKLQGDRYAMLQLLDLLLAKYRDAINERVDGDFDLIGNFTGYFEGEKDPRNLMVVFSIVLVSMSEWDLGPSTQDMFDLVFNYFPITFKPPPGDPFKITAQDLKDRLKACIASTSAFAPYAFPALLDKLDSSSMNTKRDVLQALISCIAEYEARTISLYSVTLWDALKFEILNVQEEDLAQTSLEALSLIATQLTAASEGALQAYLKPVVKECNEHLEDAPTRQSEAAGKILEAIAEVSPSLADYLVKGILPNLLALFKSSDSIPKRRGLIEVLNRVLVAVRSASKFWQTKSDDGTIISDSATSHSLRTFSKDITDILLQAVISAPKTEVSFRLVSLEGLELMLTIRQLLSEADSERILQVATDVVIHEATTSTEAMNASAIKVIIAASQHSPRLTIEKALPVLVAELPDSPEPGVYTYEPALEALAKLSTGSQLADTIIIRLKNKIHAAKRQQAPRAYIVALLTSLLYIFTMGKPAQEHGIIRIAYLSDFVLPLLYEALAIGTKGNPLATEIEVDLIGRLCNIILRVQSLHVQNQFFAANDALFRSLGALQETPESIQQQVEGSRMGIISSLYLHASFRPELYQDVPNTLIQVLLEVAKDIGNTRFVRQAALRHLTVVVNKFIPVTSANEVLEMLSPGLMDITTSASEQDIDLALAIAKGLIISGKNSKLTSQYLQSILLLLSSSSVGGPAAIGLAHLLDSDDLITKQNHCKMSGLYKQRAYHMCYEFIASDIKSAEPAAKKNFLVALTGMLRTLPYDIVQSSLPVVLPLLFQTLDLDGRFEKVKTSTLITIEAVLLYDADRLAEHANSLIARCLHCSQDSGNNEGVRTAALKCLKLVPAQLKRETVIPLRRQVITKLISCLDDKRRNVRTEAVRARTAWLALDQDDPEDV